MLKQKIKKLEEAAMAIGIGEEFIALPHQVENQVRIPPNVKCIFFDEVILKKYDIKWMGSFERFKIKDNGNIQTKN